MALVFKLPIKHNCKTFIWWIGLALGLRYWGLKADSPPEHYGIAMTSVLYWTLVSVADAGKRSAEPLR